MEVSIHANMADEETSKISDVLRGPFEIIGKDLSKDYGGIIEHLWIDFELIESHAMQRPPRSFRFQKRVSGGSAKPLLGFVMPDETNVGHYSVRPDFRALKKMPLESVVTYALNLIYSSTSVLTERQKKLGGFDAQRFRSDFVSSCKRHGYLILSHNGAR